MVKKALPVGRDSFNEIRNDGYYYVDKTGLVRDLLQPGGMVMGGFEDMFTGYLQDTISIRDVNIAKPMKKNF